MAKICKQMLVTGHVQGVFFRASTQNKAKELGVCGYARNLPDGRVQVLAQGEAQSVAKLIEWLHEGPAKSRVEKVDVADAKASDIPDEQLFQTF